MRETYTGISHVLAECHDCGKVFDARNALGLAAQHHDKTGHCVTWEQLVTGRYGGGTRAEFLAR